MDNKDQTLPTYTMASEVTEQAQMKTNAEKYMHEVVRKPPPPKIFGVDSMQEYQTTMHRSKIVEDVQTKIKDIEDDVTLKINIIVELEHNISKNKMI